MRNIKHGDFIQCGNLNSEYVVKVKQNKDKTLYIETIWLFEGELEDASYYIRMGLHPDDVAVITDDKVKKQLTTELKKTISKMKNFLKKEITDHKKFIKHSENTLSSLTSLKL